MIVAASVNPGLALAQQRRETREFDQDLADLLALILNDALRPGCSGQFSVRFFKTGQQNGGIVMEAVVRMDWPPGHRQRELSGLGSTEEGAFGALLDACRVTFGAAWPGCLA